MSLLPDVKNPRPRLRRLAVLCLGAAWPQQLTAQRGEVSGRVLTEGPERPVVEARIDLRALGLSTRSDAKGRFRLREVPAGEHVIVIRALGFDSLVASVRLAPNDVIDLDFLLARTVQSLAPVRVEGDLVRVRLAEFDERRAMGFGRFIDDSVFQKGAGRQVGDILSGLIPGLGIQRVGGKTVLVGRRAGTQCYAQVVVNGISVYNGDLAGDKLSREAFRFDVSTLDASEVVGFEWHNPASTPLKYNATGTSGGSSCGTAIFWTK